MPTPLKGCVAECIGTFALCFFGCASIILTATHPGSGADLVTVALAHGLVLAVFVTGALHISGGQFNPSVSIALIVRGKQTPQQAALYILSQCIGAACGCGALVFFLGADVANNAEAGTNLGATIGSLTTDGNTLAVFGLEVLLTFALMFTILRCLVDDRTPVKHGGIAVGIVVACCIVAFGPLTGASMNPARSLGPALYGHWDMHWVYWAAPIVGAVLASIVDATFFASEPATSD
ncbi:MAG: aquaporin [Phycisphaerales bacterium JB043]